MAYVKGQPFLPQFIDPATGLLMTNGTVEFYLAGTSTPTPYYTDSAGTSGGTSLTLNSGGKPPTDIYFDTAIDYKLVVKNAAGTVLDTIVNYSANSGLGLSTGTESIGFKLSTLGSVVRTLHDKLSDYILNVKDYGAKGEYGISGADGETTDDSAAFAACIAAVPDNLMNASTSAFIYVPRGNYYLATGADLSVGGGGGAIGIIGDGQDATIIIGGVDQVAINCTGVASDFTVISKPSWDASVAAGSPVFTKDTSGKGLYSVSGGRPRFERVTSYGWGGVGIGATRMTNGSIVCCRVTGCTTGIEVPSPSTPTTTSRIQDCYVSSTSLYGIYIDKFTHGIYDNNICEAGATGLYAVSCTGTTFSKMYFESNTVQHYKMVNCFPTILGRVIEVPGAAGTPPNASQNIYTSAISSTDLSSTIVEPDKLASTHLGFLGYDNGASTEKGLTFSEIKPTGPGRRVRGLRLLNRETDSGRLNAVGTFPMVNGAKAAHITTLHIDSAGAVVTNDDLISSVTKVGTGEYEIALKSSMYPDFVNVKTYQVYSAGATPKIHAQVAYTSANKTTYDGGGVVQKIYVVTSDLAGTQVDSGFTAEVGWNQSTDLLS